MVKQMLFKPKGMNRDNAVSVFSSELAYQIDNMRIKAFDSNNQFSLTSIKGTLKWFEGLKGTPIGHATINNNYIIFTTGDTTTEGKPDHIYKVNNSGISPIYNGDLNFDTSHPLETLVYYENEDIQKVYWTDGNNPLRYINLNNTYEGTEDLDFIKKISTLPTIQVTKLDMSGSSFSSGIILYLVTSFDLYGGESTVLTQSNTLYIAFPTRGGKKDDFVDNVFQITINNLNKYSNIRIYRLHRSSYEGIPKVDLISELNVKDKDSISVIDSGNSLSSIDPTELLYKGGLSITAETISLKDGTLFLGNIKNNINSLGQIEYNNSTIFNYFYLKALNKSLSVESSYKLLTEGNRITTSSYSDLRVYTNNDNNKYFKYGEVYRLGFVGIDKYGVKSDVIWVGDYEQLFKVSSTQGGIFKLTLDLDIVNTILNNSYLFLLPVVVYPSIHDRNIKAQGVVSPTVYNAEDRYNSVCDVLSSWFFRPSDVFTRSTGSILNYFMPYAHGHSTDVTYQNHTNELIHLSEVLSANSPHFNTPSLYVGKEDLQGETRQGTAVTPEFFINHFGMKYFIDSNIITFHSPEIENSEELYNIDYSRLKFRITGWLGNAPSYNYEYINYQADPGFYSSNDILHYNEERTLPFVIASYKDGYFNYDDSKDYSDTYFYGVHAWHRSGSLNNDVSSSSRERTSTLRNKVLSVSNIYLKKLYNHLDSALNMFDSVGDISFKDTECVLFNSTEAGLIKINTSSFYKKEFIYKGNIDTVNTFKNEWELDSEVQYYSETNDDKYISGDYLLMNLNSLVERSKVLSNDQYYYPIYGVPSTYINYLNLEKYYTGKVLKNGEIQFRDNAPTSIKYKSSPHVVINLGTHHDTNFDYYISRCLPKASISSIDYTRYQSVSDNYLIPFFIPHGDRKHTYKVYLDSININSSGSTHYIIWVGELYSTDIANRFGGDSIEALSNNNWVLCGEVIPLTKNTLATLLYSTGDTYFQIYDCLKTYPYAEGDINSIVNILSTPIETRVNLDLRADRNRGLRDNTFVRPTNFNLFNPVYNQSISFFKYHVMDLELFNSNSFKNVITWTKTKLAGATTDTWTNITMANILELDGDKGEITALKRFNNNIVAFQETGISLILYNENVQISTTQGVPIEIANSGKVQGKRYLSEQIGCTNKWSICESPLGLYFIDDKTEGIYLFNGLLSNLSDLLGFSSWIKQYYSTTRSIWNPNSFNNFITYYDKLNKEVLFINKDTCLAYSEYLKQFTSFYSYGNVPYFGYIDNQFISINNESVYKNEKGDYSEFYGEFKPFGVTVIANADAPYDKIFNTLEFRTSSQSDLANPSVQCSDYTFNYINVWNDYLKAEDYLLFLKNKVSNLKRKFRIWRANIPREGRDRMRNPWLFIKMTRNDSYAKPYPLELHDMIVQYFI